jgi:hypothetical protein
MAKKPTMSMEFDARVKNFKFSNEHFLKGANISPPSRWKKIQLKHTLKKMGHILINQRERKIDFRFTLEMHPDLGEVNFDGECILESPEQHKISFILQKIPKAMDKFLDPIIIKNSYYNAEKIWKKHDIKLPSVDKILTMPEKKGK